MPRCIDHPLSYYRPGTGYVEHVVVIENRTHVIRLTPTQALNHLSQLATTLRESTRDLMALIGSSGSP